MKYMVLNFSYGFGPMLRAMEVAVCLNRIREKRGEEALGIIMPLVYGEKQKQIVREDFGEYLEEHGDRGTIYDEILGSLLMRLFYTDGDFWGYVSNYLSNYDEVQSQVLRHFSTNGCGVPTDDIVLEIARAPRVLYGLPQAVNFSFAHQSQIFDRYTNNDKKRMSISKEVAKHFQNLENTYSRHYIAYPGTLSAMSGYGKVYESEILTPPHIGRKKRDKKYVVPEDSVYISMSGIDAITFDVDNINLPVYTNRVDKIPTGTVSKPNILGEEYIIVQIARAGWGAIWTSIIYGKPILMFPPDLNDDPEISQNIETVRMLGIGDIYVQGLVSDQQRMSQMRENIVTLRDEILSGFGTLYGAEFIAEDIHATGYQI